jgi:hypothetical protein
MPQPQLSDVHVDKPLTNTSLAFMQSQDRFVASKVFPVVSVDKKSDSYFTFPRSQWFRDEAAVRAPATESAGSGYTQSTDSYECRVFAIHKDVPDQVVANADRPLNPMQDATRFLTQLMLLRQEKQFVSDVFSTGVWDTDVAGATDFTQWDDDVSSDPIADIELGKETILQNTGQMPNVLVLGYQTWRHLKHHPNVIDRMNVSSDRVAGEDILARLFGVDRVLVASSVEDTAAEAGTSTFAFTHGKHAVLLHVAPRPGILTPSAGYTYSWRGVGGGRLGAAVAIKRFRMEELAAWRVEAEAAWDNKIVSAPLGYFFSAAVS